MSRQRASAASRADVRVCDVTTPVNVFRMTPFPSIMKNVGVLLTWYLEKIVLSESNAYVHCVLYCLMKAAVEFASAPLYVPATEMKATFFD